MKKYIFILLLFSIGSSLFGQDFINYQFVPRDGNGNPIFVKSFTLSIKNEAGSIVYQEQIDSLFNTEDVYNIKIGSKNPASFSQIDWSLSNYSIGTTLRTFDNTVINFPDQPIGSTPRAFYADKAGTAKGVDDIAVFLNTDINKYVVRTGIGDDAIDSEGPEIPAYYWRVRSFNRTPPTPRDTILITKSKVTVGTPLNDQYPTTLAPLTLFNSNAGADFYNANNQRYTTIGYNSTVEIGAIGTFYPTGAPGILNIGNAGKVASQFIYGPNGNLNFSASSLSGSPNNGFLTVNNDQGAAEVSIYVAANGQGTVAADVKNFRMEHPTEPGKEIWYASVEGPEAAAYVRGTAKLQNGQVKVAFPEHFSLVANATTMTVILTPLSADSKGLAVIEKGETGFVVKELQGGTGSYEFDWEVKAVRKGYEDYRVIRDAKEAMPAEPIKLSKF
ncbi:MAG: hypothetical protein SFU99_14135 [Saprospiraceae bacterium]|nr:hypothetical protein [Saprospiraceae bacterium]